MVVKEWRIFGIPLQKILKKAINLSSYTYKLTISVSNYTLHILNDTNVLSLAIKESQLDNKETIEVTLPLDVIRHISKLTEKSATEDLVITRRNDQYFLTGLGLDEIIIESTDLSSNVVINIYNHEIYSDVFLSSWKVVKSDRLYVKVFGDKLTQVLSITESNTTAYFVGDVNLTGDFEEYIITGGSFLYSILGKHIPNGLPIYIVNDDNHQQMVFDFRVKVNKNLYGNFDVSVVYTEDYVKDYAPYRNVYYTIYDLLLLDDVPIDTDRLSTGINTYIQLKLAKKIKPDSLTKLGASSKISVQEFIDCFNPIQDIKSIRIDGDLLLVAKHDHIVVVTLHVPYSTI